jgi:hypothetical protein
MKLKAAFRAIQDGFALTHRYFTDNEFIKKSDIGYEFEDGTKCTEDEFWQYRSTAEWGDGWILYEKQE